MLGGLAMLIGSAFAQSGWLALAGTVIFLTNAVWGIVKGRTIAAVKIDKKSVWVSGICRDFLNQLPELQPIELAPKKDSLSKMTVSNRQAHLCRGHWIVQTVMDEAKAL